MGQAATTLSLVRWLMVPVWCSLVVCWGRAVTCTAVLITVSGSQRCSSLDTGTPSYTAGGTPLQCGHLCCRPAPCSVTVSSQPARERNLQRGSAQVWVRWSSRLTSILARLRLDTETRDTATSTWTVWLERWRYCGERSRHWILHTTRTVRPPPPPSHRSQMFLV